MGQCRRCGHKSMIISSTLGYCVDCIRNHLGEVWPYLKLVHEQSRKAYSLPESPPRAEKGLTCDQCHNDCSMADGQRGYCGVRYVEGGKIKGGRPHEGNLYFYHDPLPTNCVGSFACPAGTGAGYPQYAYFDGPERGYKNLAVFYHACTFNCLYCQNYHFKEYTYSRKVVTAKTLARAVDEKTSCICYFGGDPTPQILHAIKASRLALEKARGRILRVCWETNGAMEEKYLNEVAQLSLVSGGCIKFDLKAWNQTVHLALCGVSNKKTLENFAKLGRMVSERANPPFLIASTLLVPGYVDSEEVKNIARFIASIDPSIPYSLLAFYPHFYLKDLPTTSRNHAIECKREAEKAGLKNVHVGNIHLLGKDY